jgi:hypothetical protein
MLPRKPAIHSAPITIRSGPFEKNSRSTHIRFGFAEMSSSPGTICLGRSAKCLGLFEKCLGYIEMRLRLFEKWLSPGPKTFGL